MPKEMQKSHAKYMHSNYNRSMITDLIKFRKNLSNWQLILISVVNQEININECILC